MKKTIIALIFLALVSIPIARTLAGVRTVADPNTVPIVPIVTLIDPSTIPKSDAVTSMPAGVASTYNIYPSTTSVNTYYTLSDTWFGTPIVAILAPQATGHYEFYEYIYITNPSYKWASACLAPYVIPQPYTIVSSYGYLWGLPSNSYLKPVASNMTWSGQNLFVWRVWVVADVISTSGVFNVNMPFNQMKTDQNGDGKVDMKDIGAVASHYGTTFTPDQPRNYAWNLVLDFAVDWTDINAVVVEFGRTIPP